ncbi:hypothetical protein V6N13_089641 [Hibiscus sabdariffa]|uniref:Uncharacterized protein n=1 Tax=Hibiscus sabdariffa TaxID=183260 RepID=A0ABR2QJP1_9ROSI
MRKIRKCRHLVRPTPKALGLTTRMIHNNETIVPLLYHPSMFSQGRLSSEESDGVTLLSSSSGISSRAMRHVDRGIFWFHILKLLFIRCLLIQEEEEEEEERHGLGNENVLRILLLWQL